MPAHSTVAKSALVLAAVVALAACNDELVVPEAQVIEDADFAPGLAVDLSAMEKLPSGVYIQDVEVGTGDAAEAGNSVEVGYAGYLTSGQTFDAGTFPFTLGAGQVIPGFDEGVMGMQVGGKRRIIIPPEQGYGNQAVGSIPGGSILIFDVELLSIS